jgi:predicted enzyme related to lactoylglutathione lyase
VKIALTSVFVHSPMDAFKFYTEVLGFIPRMYVPAADIAIVASPEQPDGTGLLLEPNDNPVAKTYQEAVYTMGLPVIIFGVDDIQAEYQRLKRLGVTFRGEPQRADWGAHVLLEDTCGNLIQLHQP